MPELSTQIREYFDVIDPPFNVDELFAEITPQPVVVIEQKPVSRPGRRPWLVAVAAAIAVLLLIGGAAFLARLEAPDRPVAPEIQELNGLPLNTIPAFRALVRVGPNEPFEVEFTESVDPEAVYTVEVTRGIAPAGFRAQIVAIEGSEGPEQHPELGWFLAWDGGAEAVEVVEGHLQRIAVGGDEESRLGFGLDDYSWQTGRWRERCAGANEYLLGGEGEVLAVTSLLGREVLHLSCHTPHERWELWVDGDTGLVLKATGSTEVNEFFPRTGPEGGFAVVEIEFTDEFSVETFSTAVPPGLVELVEEDLCCGLDTESVTPESPVAEAGRHPSVGEGAPALSGPLLRGGSFDLAEYRGQPLVLLVWASWCPPCLEDMTDLELIAAERPDLAIVTLLVADEIGPATEVIDRARFTLPVVDLTGASEPFLSEWSIYGYPATIYVAADGTVAQLWLGEMGADAMRSSLLRLGW